jgi:hypothetical protein
MARIWYHGGANGPLANARDRLAYPPEKVNPDRLGRNDLLHRLNAAICDMAERYRANLRAHGGIAEFTTPELRNVRDALDDAEWAVRRLAVMTLAAMEMVDTAAAAHGVAAPARGFAIAVGPEGHPAGSAEIAALRAELETLRSDRANVLATIEQAAALIDSLTAERDDARRRVEALAAEVDALTEQLTSPTPPSRRHPEHPEHPEGV